MKNYFRMLCIMLGMGLMVQGAVAQGIFTSAATGNWNAAGSWTLTSGSDADGIPDADDNVTIAATHVMNIDDNSACNNLSFAAGTSKVAFNTASKSLTLNGNVVGVSASDDYTSGTSASGTKLIVGGSGAQATTLIGGSCNWPDVEINKSAGTFALSGGNFRIDGNLTVTAGTMDANANSISMNTTSTVTVSSATSLINVGRLATTTGGTTAMGTVTIDGTFSGANLYITALTINSGGVLDVTGTTGFSASANPATMTCNTGSTVKYSGAAQTGRFVNYHHLVLSGGTTAGSAIKTISAVGSMTVGGDLTISNGARLTGSGNYTVTGTTTINDNGEILWNGVTGSTFICNGALNINGNSGNGVVRFGGASTTTPAYTFNGDVAVSAATTVSAFNLNSGTAGSANRTFEGVINFNGNVAVASGAATLTFTTTADPASTNIRFGGTDKSLTLSSGTSFINLRGDITFTTSRAISAPGGGGFTFTTRPSSVTPEWTIQVDNGAILLVSPGAYISLPNRAISDGTGAGDLDLQGDLRIGLAGGWNSAITITGTKTIGSSSTITFNGSSAQATGSNLPASLANMTLNNTAGVTLSGTTSLGGALTFTLGNLTLGSNNLTLGSSATISGANSSRYIVTDGTGAVYRAITAGNSFQFHVGPSATEYNPLTITLDPLSGSETFNVRVQNGFSNAPPNAALCVQKTWHINKGAGAVDADLTFQWRTSEEGGSFVRNASSAFRWDANDNRYYEGAGSGGFPTGSDPWVGTYVGATTFSPYIIGQAGGLPVQLSSFTGTVTTGNRVRLDWRTASEVNNLGFYVQKRLRGAGEWTEIPNSFIAGHGTTSVPQQYTYTDAAPIIAATEYRLRQVDLDGSEHFNDPIVVDLPTSVIEPAPKHFALMQNFPNPFNPETNIKFSVAEAGLARLVVYNSIGQEVATLFNDIAEPGRYYQVRFTGNGLSSGVYFYRLTSGKQSELKKLMLVK